jgi:hypothetical protein
MPVEEEIVECVLACEGCCREVWTKMQRRECWKYRYGKAAVRDNKVSPDFFQNFDPSYATWSAKVAARGVLTGQAFPRASVEVLECRFAPISDKICDGRARRGGQGTTGQPARNGACRNEDPYGCRGFSWALGVYSDLSMGPRCGRAAGRTRGGDRRGEKT